MQIKSRISGRGDSMHTPIDTHLHPPYPPRPQPAIQVRRWPMTIAAGFSFKDGILLCADTERTFGEFKFTGSKILSHKFPTGYTAFAIAGGVDYATMAIQEIVRDLKSQPELSNAIIEEKVKARIGYIYERLLNPHPRATFEGSPFFDLIGAVWTKADGLGLLASSESAVVWETEYTCRGIGLTLAEYLIKPMYSVGMTRGEAESLAAYTLSHVKDSISGCGGESEFVVVDNVGIHPVRHSAKVEHEDFTELFDTYLPTIFSYAGDLDKSDKDVKLVLEAFVSGLMSQRGEFRNLREKRKEALRKARERIAKALK
jgi:20S proteasome alpha/beta subunit